MPFPKDPQEYLGNVALPTQEEMKRPPSILDNPPVDTVPSGAGGYFGEIPQDGPEMSAPPEYLDESWLGMMNTTAKSPVEEQEQMWKNWQDYRQRQSAQEREGMTRTQKFMDLVSYLPDVLEGPGMAVAGPMRQGSPMMRSKVAQFVKGIKDATKPGSKMRKAMLAILDEGPWLSPRTSKDAFDKSGAAGTWWEAGQEGIEYPLAKAHAVRKTQQQIDIRKKEMPENLRKVDEFLVQAQEADRMGMPENAEDFLKMAQEYKEIAGRNKSQIKKWEKWLKRQPEPALTGGGQPKSGQAPMMGVQEQFTRGSVPAHETTHALQTGLRKIDPAAEEATRDILASDKFRDFLLGKSGSTAWSESRAEPLANYFEEIAGRPANWGREGASRGLNIMEGEDYIVSPNQVEELESLLEADLSKLVGSAKYDPNRFNDF